MYEIVLMFSLLLRPPQAPLPPQAPPVREEEEIKPGSTDAMGWHHYKKDGHWYAWRWVQREEVNLPQQPIFFQQPRFFAPSMMNNCAGGG